MNLITWLSRKLGGNPVKVSGEGWRDEAFITELYTDACYRDMALFTAVDMMARFISKCEFKVFLGGREDSKNPEWYRWNIQPNKNQSSSTFLRKLIFSLYYNQECLVVENAGELFVADAFTRKPYVLYEDIFEQVTVDDYVFNRRFEGHEVMYWNLDALGSGRNMQRLIFGVCESYAKLLSYAMQSFQTSRGSKALFKYDSLPPNSSAEEANQWLQSQIKKYGKFLSADGGVVTIGKGTELESFDRKTTYSNESTRDIRHLVDDISDFTAKAIGLHPALLRGDVQDISSAMDFTLTVAVDPLADFLREEIVRKLIGRSMHAKGYDFVIDTRSVKHIDLLSIHAAVEKLVGSGVFCVNDIRKLLGEPVIDEPWAWRHFMTRNYSTVEELLKAMEGGE